MRTEDGARREQDAFIRGLLRQLRGILDVWKPRPNEHSRPWITKNFDAASFERPAKVASRYIEALLEPREIFSVVPFGEHRVNDAFDELGTRDAREHLDVGEIGRETGRARDEAHAQTARERLRETARIDDTFELVERGESRRRRCLEIGENVVFDDAEPVAFGDL